MAKKIRDRKEFFLGKIAGREDVDVNTLMPPGASSTEEELLLEIAERIDGIGNNGGGSGGSGADSLSPIATVEQTATGATISITDKNGTTTAVITNGIDGVDGQDGQDGHTPVKGTDYWTAQDKASVVQDVLAALPTWQGGDY